MNVVDECQNYMVETTMVLGSSFFLDLLTWVQLT